jgi:rRNA biogenesis protein RRP5
VGQKGSASEDSKRVIKDPVDPSISNMRDLSPGVLVKGRIISIKPTQMNVSLGSNLQARVHISELVSSIDDFQNVKQPWTGYKAGDVISFKVASIQTRSSGVLLPISQGHLVPVTSQSMVELTLRKEDLALENGKLAVDSSLRHPTIESVTEGSVYLGFVQKVTDNAVWALLGPSLMGRCKAIEVSLDDTIVPQSLTSSFPLGSPIRAFVLSKNTAKFELDLSIRGAEAMVSPSSKRPEFPLTFETIKVGHILVGRVSKAVEKRGLSIQLADGLFGTVHLSEISNDMPKHPTSSFSVGNFVKCAVMAVSKPTQRIELTLRLDEDGSPSETTFQVDQVIKGYIKNIADAGVFVDVGAGYVARVKIADLSDDFIKDWQSLYHIGDQVSGLVLR